MTRRSPREIENALDDLQGDPDAAPEATLDEEHPVVSQVGVGWIDSFTGEPVDVDESDLIIDFEEVDT